MPLIVPPFTIEYETRDNSATFLNALSPDSPVDDSYIDYHYISTARDEILAWLEKQNDKSLAVIELYRKILSITFFIWYELPPDSDAITMFARINLGKIPLTNAELIKALLMSKDNFVNGMSKRQIEISDAWDRIEQGLRDDSFWYFLNQEDKSGTRIDLLYEILANKYNSELKNPIEKAGNDYFPFLVLAEKQKEVDISKREEGFVKPVWDKVEALYSEFRNWYLDLNKYHIIGFLITCGLTIQEISSDTKPA
jgi:hypothetical protein